MKVKIEVTPTINPDRLLIEKGIFEENEKLSTKLCRQVIELEDQAVREALVNFGWTPPNQKIKCPFCKMDFLMVP